MAGKKKRLKKLVAAVSAILGDKQEAKKLRKTEALERFIVKLKDKHREMERELAKGSLEGAAAKEKSRRVKDLGKQIRKAEKILAKMM
jgi:hypothetical protein